MARSQAELDLAKLEIEQAGGNALRLRADVRDLEQLMAAVDKAMERAQKAQRDAAQGQTGLFGLFDETPKAGRGGEDLPRVADWEEGERLANEKEVLGFYLTSHPLAEHQKPRLPRPNVWPWPLLANQQRLHP